MFRTKFTEKRARVDDFASADGVSSPVRGRRANDQRRIGGRAPDRTEV